MDISGHDAFTDPAASPLAALAQASPTKAAASTYQEEAVTPTVNQMLLAAAFGAPVNVVQATAEEEPAEQYEEVTAATALASGYTITDEELAMNLASYDEEAATNQGYYDENGTWVCGYYDDIYRWHDGYYDENDAFIETGITGFGVEATEAEQAVGQQALEQHEAEMAQWQQHNYQVCEVCATAGPQLCTLQAAAAGHKDCLQALLWVRIPDTDTHAHCTVNLHCSHAHAMTIRPLPPTRPSGMPSRQPMEPSARRCTWRQRTVKRSVSKSWSCGALT